jgi:hypothetical protein
MVLLWFHLVPSSLLGCLPLKLLLEGISAEFTTRPAEAAESAIDGLSRDLTEFGDSLGRPAESMSLSLAISLCKWPGATAGLVARTIAMCAR